jgi:hypothetical protein
MGRKQKAKLSKGRTESLAIGGLSANISFTTFGVAIPVALVEPRGTGHPRFWKFLTKWRSSPYFSNLVQLIGEKEEEGEEPEEPSLRS